MFREVVKRPTPVRPLEVTLAEILEIRVRLKLEKMSKIANLGIRFEPKIHLIYGHKINFEKLNSIKKWLSQKKEIRLPAR